MLHHVVLFKKKAGVSSTLFLELVEGLRDLVGVIPEMQNFWLSTNPTEKSNWDACLKIEFESQAALDVYSVHESHAKLAQEINKIADVAVFDGF